MKTPMLTTTGQVYRPMAEWAADNEKAELIRAALLIYARSTCGRERSLCENLAAQAEDMVEAIAQ